MYRCVMTWLLIICPLIGYAKETVLSLYRPFADNPNHPRITIVTSTSGQCWLPSELIMREDAWHCKADNGVIYDPCFSKRFGSRTRVVCPQSPWNGNSVELTLNTPLREQTQQTLNMSRGYPWALELVNGEHCQASSSTNAAAIRYRCSQDLVLTGELQRCATVWTITQQSPSGVAVASIARAWF